MIKKVDIKSQVIRTEKVATLEIEIDGTTQYIDIDYSIENDSDAPLLDSITINGFSSDGIPPSIPPLSEKETIIECIKRVWSNYSFTQEEEINIKKWIQEALDKYGIEKKE